VAKVDNDNEKGGRMQVGIHGLTHVRKDRTGQESGEE